MTTKPSWIGYTLNNRYKIEGELGQGGMSAVYRATDPNLRRTVAVKLIHSHLANDLEFVRRFEEEAAAVARLRHPNIIQVFDFSHDGETYYMVLEFLPGHTLLDRLEQANRQGQLLSVAEILNIMVPLCEAVAYAHQQGMVHRDLKPANVMINPQGQPILMDFGIAKIVGGGSMTATGGVIGTVAYMSPEQIRGQKPDHRADIYALGIILYQIVSGRLPFQGDNTAATMMQHLNNPVPDVRQFNRSVSPALVAIIQKALAKEPGQRYQSAEEMGSALRQMAPEGTGFRQGMMASPPMPSAMATQAITGSTRPQIPATETSAPTRRPAWLIPATIGVSILVLFACLVVAVVGGQKLLAAKDPTITPTTFFVAAVPTITSTENSASEIGEEPPEAEDTAVLPQTTSNATTATTVTTATPTPTTVIEPTIALIPTSTALPTNPPVATSAPTLVATSPPVATPTTGLRAEITSITLADDHYVVAFAVYGYFSDTSSTHVHFFWNTIAPDQAGVPANPGNWKLYGSPSPFTGYTVAERPGGATQLCILVANPDHSVRLGTGNCVDLP
ncbi:MAG: serine/threonine-protein kinase [Candidatus Promineifilaceae bacterium]